MSNNDGRVDGGGCRWRPQRAVAWSSHSPRLARGIPDLAEAVVRGFCGWRWRRTTRRLRVPASGSKVRHDQEAAKDEAKSLQTRVPRHWLSVCSSMTCPSLDIAVYISIEQVSPPSLVGVLFKGHACRESRVQMQTCTTSSHTRIIADLPWEPGTHVSVEHTSH